MKRYKIFWLRACVMLVVVLASVYTVSSQDPGEFVHDIPLVMITSDSDCQPLEQPEPVYTIPLVWLTSDSDCQSPVHPKPVVYAIPLVWLTSDSDCQSP